MPIEGGFSLKSFSALLLGGLGGVALFKINQLDKSGIISGQVVEAFKIGRLLCLSFIIAGAMAWPVKAPKIKESVMIFFFYIGLHKPFLRKFWWAPIVNIAMLIFIG